MPTSDDLEADSQLLAIVVGVTLTISLVIVFVLCAEEQSRRNAEGPDERNLPNGRRTSTSTTTSTLPQTLPRQSQSIGKNDRLLVLGFVYPLLFTGF